MNVNDVRQYFLDLEGCCLSNEAKEVAMKIDECLAFVESENDGPSGYALVKVGPLFYVLSDWQDYTGHGCQCDARVDGPFDTREDAIKLGLDDDGRALLASQLSAVA